MSGSVLRSSRTFRTPRDAGAESGEITGPNRPALLGPECRSPKPEIRMKPEFRIPKVPTTFGLGASAFGLRASFGFRVQGLNARMLSGNPLPALLCLLTTLFAGCAGYQLGPTGGQTAGARSIQINPFVNQTIEPRLVEALTHALRKQIQQDGTFRLDTHNEGDIVVSGEIVRYDRQSISVRARDALTPRDYRITIVAHITARERATGKVLLDRELTGHTDVRTGADLFSAERQGIPLAAEFLASSATSLLADGPW
jgi:hypothetical protein